MDGQILLWAVEESPPVPVFLASQDVNRYIATCLSVHDSLSMMCLMSLLNINSLGPRILDN